MTTKTNDIREIGVGYIFIGSAVLLWLAYMCVAGMTKNPDFSLLITIIIAASTIITLLVIVAKQVWEVQKQLNALEANQQKDVDEG